MVGFEKKKEETTDRPVTKADKRLLVDAHLRGPEFGTSKAVVRILSTIGFFFFLRTNFSA